MFSNFAKNIISSEYQSKVKSKSTKDQLVEDKNLIETKKGLLKDKKNKMSFKIRFCLKRSSQVGAIH